MDICILLCVEALIAKAWVPFPWPCWNWKKKHTAPFSFLFSKIPQNTKHKRTRWLIRCPVLPLSSSSWRRRRAQSWVWCCRAGALQQRAAATTSSGPNSLRTVIQHKTFAQTNKLDLRCIHCPLGCIAPSSVTLWSGQGKTTPYSE